MTLLHFTAIGRDCLIGKHKKTGQGGAPAGS